MKEILIPEGELTDWAKNELEEARKTPSSQYTSHEEVKRKILTNSHQKP